MALDPSEVMWPLIPVTAGIATASRPYRDGHGQFLKWLGGGNPKKVQREWDFLYAAGLQGVAPRALRHGTNWILMEDLGDPQPYDGTLEALREAGNTLLAGLVVAGIRHNDLRPHNLIWTRARLWAIDYSWSRWVREGAGEFRHDEDARRLAASLSAILEGAWE